jgi:transcriptional regulator with XRE-family HTH domain
MINQQLLEARLEKGWSIEVASARIGVGRVTYSRWENGHQEPQSKVLAMLCKTFGKSAYDLGFGHLSKEPSEAESDEDMNRREVIKAIGAAGARLLVPQVYFNPETWDRLSKSLAKRPSSVDPALVDGLKRTTENHWNLRLAAGIPFPVLLNSVIGHLQVILRLLQNSHPLSISIALHSVASETSQLAGVLMFDMNYHDSAHACYQFSLDTAKEANNAPLAAAALGRTSIIHATQEKPSEALSLLKEAQSLAGQRNAFTLCSWLAGEEAEAHAHLQKQKDCEAALAQGEHFVHLIQPQEDSYGIGFTRSRLSAYQGTCYMRLHQPESAIKALTQGLNSSESPEVFKRLILADLAEASIQAGDIDRACSYLIQSLELIAHQNSIRSLGDIRKLRQRLERWSTAQAIKNLDDKLRPFSKVA